MGINERRTRQKEEIKTLILDAAWKQIQDEGCQSLSIRKVADAIEYSIPVIYSHFESKDALVAEFVRRGYRLLNEGLEAAKNNAAGITGAGPEAEPAGQLRAMGLAYCAFGVDHREYYQMMFGLGIPACDAIRQMPEVQAFTELVKGTIGEVIRGSRHPEANEYLKFKSFWALLHGLISINMSGGAEESATYSRAIWEDAIGGFIFALRG